MPLIPIVRFYGGSMYSFFYPENNSRFSSAEEHIFDTIEKAIAYWKDRHQIWEDITIPGGEPAFMNSGEIVVVRKI